MSKYFNNYGCGDKPVYYASLEYKLYSESNPGPATSLLTAHFKHRQ